MESMSAKCRDRLDGLDALGAVQVWLDGAYGVGEEPSLVALLRRKLNLDLFEREVRELLYDALDHGWSANVILERLKEADESSEGVYSPGSHPR
ncbi:MAG: hypothetical protein DWH79_12015 [Planctomycetota bacterium]|nr:MAG: hypothetical protein DWH79_12015 [Planctomycetota bacterium]